jgi:hypothetical protein
MRNLILRAAVLALAAAGVAGTATAAVAPAASAATTSCLVVDTNSDHSYASLQAAVNAAASGDRLFVKGTCTGTSTQGGGATTYISTNLTISGQSASGTKTATISGGGLGEALQIYNGATVTLNTLIITGGSAAVGAGITDYSCTVTLNHSTVSGNVASEYGGGILNEAGTVTLNGSTVTGNTAKFDAGGIYNTGVVTLNGSTVTGNTTTTAFGGGIANNFGTMNLNGSTVTGNTASAGGGGIDNGGTMTLNSSTVSGNTALRGDGGGILNFCGSPLVGAVDGGNVYNNTPDNIATACT